VRRGGEKEGRCVRDPQKKANVTGSPKKGTLGGGGIRKVKEFWGSGEVEICRSRRKRKDILITLTRGGVKGKQNVVPRHNRHRTPSILDSELGG